MDDAAVNVKLRRLSDFAYRHEGKNSSLTSSVPLCARACACARAGDFRHAVVRGDVLLNVTDLPLNIILQSHTQVVVGSFVSAVADSNCYNKKM